jgi:opacity protein-like surface antigen
MSCRFLTILALTLALGSAASAQTAPVPEAAPAPNAAASSTEATGQVTTGDPKATPPTGLAGFEVLASVGYGTITEFKTLEANPYGGAFGLHVGYTWNMGFHLGAEVSYGLGHSIPQTFEYRRGQVDLTSVSESFTSLLSISYDLWLHMLILRYSIGLGVTWMHWDLGELEGVYGGYAAPSGSSASFVFAPGLALLWPFHLFEFGLGFDYLFQAEYENPSGIVGQLLVGIKL